MQNFSQIGEVPSPRPFNITRILQSMTLKRARAVWKLRALKFNMAAAMNVFIVEEFYFLFVQTKQRMFGITRWRSSGVPIEEIRII